jgi:hypothetical protein
MADVTSPFGFPYPEGTDLVRDGAQDIENLAEGVNDYLAGGYLYAGTRYFTSSGTFAKADPLGTGDIGLRAIRVTCVGGGGGAGRSRADRCAAGGGGANTVISFITDMSTVSATVVATVGAGGNGATSDDSNGELGGASSFGSLVVANGGRGTTTSGIQALDALGAGNVGDRTWRGSSGGSGSSSSNDSGGGSGGSSVFGGGAQGHRGGTDGAGTSSGAFGGGGGGGTGAFDGGNGGAGIVIVDCFV